MKLEPTTSARFLPAFLLLAGVHADALVLSVLVCLRWRLVWMVFAALCRFLSRRCRDLGPQCRQSMIAKQKIMLVEMLIATALLKD